MFGQKSNFGGSLFGSSTSFGSQNSLFGAKTTSPFGTTAPATGSLFGATAPATTSSSLFGSTTPAAPTGLFGSTNAFAQSGASLFGGAQAKPLFGGSNTFATQPAQSTNTGLFGQASTQPTSSLFGASSSSTGVSMFGSALGQSGTTVKFEPVIASDTMLRNSIQTNINTKHQCITSMKQYENKSLEELRVEDYLQNRKGPQQTGTLSFGNVAGQTTTTGSLFGGSTSVGTSLFSQQQNKPAFGSSLFGSVQTTPTLGQSTTSAAGGGLFGQTKPLFGSATTSSPFALSTSNKPGEGLFGQQQKTSTGLFGSTPATSTSFGQQATFNFGQPQPQQTGGLFGSFGAATSTPAAQTTSLFGNVTNAASGGGGLFGNKPATSTTPSGSLFGPFGGTQTTQQTSLFGNQQTQQKPFFGGAFGQAAASKPATTGAFGSGLFSTPASTVQTGLFNSFNKTAPAIGTSPFGSTGLFSNTSTTFPATSSFTAPGAGLTIANDQAIQAAQEALVRSQLSILANSPYGQSPLLKLIDAPTASPTDPQKQREALSLSFGSNADRSKPLPPIRSYPRILAGNVTLPPAIKARPSSGLLDELERSKGSSPATDGFVPKRNIKKLTIRNFEEVKQTPAGTLSSRLINGHANHVDVDETPMVNGSESQISPILPVMTKSKPSKVVKTPNYDAQPSRARQLPCERVGAAGVVCEREDYYCQPSVEELTQMFRERGECVVPNFVVGRVDYGSVSWPGPLDVSNLNLDRLVHFTHREVTVYPENECKPPVGAGLNRPAKVTLERMWPTDKTTGLPISDPMRIEVLKYRQKLEKACKRMGAKFVDFDVTTGRWVFEVSHFSKYGLVSGDSSDEEEEVVASAEESFKNVQSTRIADVDMDSPVDSLEFISPVVPVRSGKQLLLKESESFQIDGRNASVQPSNQPGPISKKVKLHATDVSVLDSLVEKVEHMMDTSKLPSDRWAVVRERIVGTLEKKSQMVAVAMGDSLTAEMEGRGVAGRYLRRGFKVRWLGSRQLVKLSEDKTLGALDLCTFESDHCLDKCARFLKNLSNSNGEEVGGNLTIEKAAKFSNPTYVSDRLNEESWENPLWSQTFHLYNALFCPLEGGQTIESMVDAIRIRRLQSWLTMQSKKDLDKIDEKSQGSALFKCLLTGDSEQAAKQASFDGNNRLALLIASVALDVYAGELVAELLEDWSRVKADEFVDDQLLKVYAALAGKTELKGSKRIRVLENLRWPLVLSYLMRFCPNSWQSVSGALEHFEQLSLKTEHDSDVQYNLIKLYADEKCSVDAVLDRAFEEDAFDFRLCWLLWYAFKAIGNRSLSADCSVRLHASFASQLEASGRWTDAAFVLTHIENDVVRKRAFQDFLLRLINEDEQVLLNVLQLFDNGELVLFDALALNGKVRRNWREEFVHYLNAGRDGAAQNLFICQIAPELFIQKNFVELDKVATMLKQRGHFSKQFVDLADLLGVVKDTTEDIQADSVQESFKFDKEKLKFLLSTMTRFPVRTRVQRLFRRQATECLKSALNGGKTVESYPQIANGR